MNYKFDFYKYRKIYFIISGVIMLLGIVSLLIFGLNLGVDFKSGTRIEINIEQNFVEKDIRSLLKDAETAAKEQGIKDVDLTPSIVRQAGNKNGIAVVRFDQTINSDVLPVIKEVFRSKYGEQVDLIESKVDPTIGRELARKAFYAVLWASLGIIIYVSIRFEFRFGVTAIIALFHDAFFVIAIFSLLRLEVDLTFIAAILTIVGYSINDTIVIFDRIRENMKLNKVKRARDIENIVNISLNQTLARSINTSLTVLFTALALFILGGEGIKNFSLALVLGLISGAYSSIFIAAPIWALWKGKDLDKKKFKPQIES
nr:protein translocase subunit SecF [Vulcanibacillus modesticaldus]